MDPVPEETHKDIVENSKKEPSPMQEKPRVPPVPEPPKKSKRDDKRKDDRYMEQFTKALNAASTPEEKIKIATDNYAHMVDDNKKMQFYIKQSEKRYTFLMKEKEQLQHEFNKTVLVKSKLENLCRELQKQNKAIKDESLLKIREEEERLKETQAKFQNTLSEITALLQQNNEKNTKLRDDNISMTEKFKSVVQQYQLREQQVEKMSNQMALEQQLSEAKLQKARLEQQAERERLVAEMETMKLTVAQYRAKVKELQETETGLRSKVAVYSTKYDEFQNALVKSNQMFRGFKDEMDQMSKKIKKLEKESLSWKKRWETSQAALLEMCGERQAREAASRQLASMQSLCRTLQAERTLLLNTLKENNIERPPMVAVPAPLPPPQPQTHSDAKVDAMAANCAQLRQSLAHLQTQLNVLTTNKQAEEQSKSEKPKKKIKKIKTPKAETRKESESDQREASESDNKEVIPDVKNNEPAVAEPNLSVQEPNLSVQEPNLPIKEPNVSVQEPIVSVQEPNIPVAVQETPIQIDIADEKVDDKTLESLIEAFSSANLDIIDIQSEEVFNNPDIVEIKTSDDNSNDIKDIIPEAKVTEIVNVDEKVIPTEQSQTIEPKSEVITEVKTNEVQQKSETQVNGV